MPCGSKNLQLFPQPPGLRKFFFYFRNIDMENEKYLLLLRCESHAEIPHLSKGRYNKIITQ